MKREKKKKPAKGYSPDNEKAGLNLSISAPTCSCSDSPAQSLPFKARKQEMLVFPQQKVRWVGQGPPGPAQA